jgi:hypothetical protein
MISATASYRTRAGSRVRIYATDCGGDYPIHGAYCYDDEGIDIWYLAAWKANGQYTGTTDDEYESAFDLVEDTTERDNPPKRGKRA